MASISRRFLNKELIPKFAELFNGGNILFVGKHPSWDYSTFFTTRGCNYQTLDINPGLKPDIVADIQSTGLPDKSYDGILVVGMYELIKDWDKAINEIYRLLKGNGWALITFAGEGFFFGTTKPEEIFKKVEPFRVSEAHVVYYKNRKVEYLNTICRK